MTESEQRQIDELYVKIYDLEKALSDQQPFIAAVKEIITKCREEKNGGQCIESCRFFNICDRRV